MLWKLLLMAHLHQFLSRGRSTIPSHETRLTFSLLLSLGARPPWSNFLKARTLLLVVGLEMGSLPCLLMRRGSAEFVRPLNADHKGADTRLLLHAKHATKDVAGVVIQSPDNNVLVLSVSHCKEISSGPREQWFWTGLKTELYTFQCTKLLQDLGHSYVRQFLPFTHWPDATLWTLYLELEREMLGKFYAKT